MDRYPRLMCQIPSHRQAYATAGFTLVEVLIAIVIAGLLLAVSVSGASRFYDSVQYRQGVRDVITILGSARREAIDSGSSRDVMLDVDALQVSSNGQTISLPSNMTMQVSSAKDLNLARIGVVRFYPDGSSTGGDVWIETPSGSGVQISVDWLMGQITQASYSVD